MSISLLTRCIACDEHAPRASTFPLCETCLSALIPGLNLTRPDSEVLASHYSLFQLTDAAYEVLKKWKTRRGPIFDQKVLRQVDLEKLRQHLEKIGIEAVVPMPQDYLRSWKMRGSPALRITKFVAKVGRRPVLNQVLLRKSSKQGPRQAELTGWSRKQTRLEFRAERSPLGVKSVLLVDDFSTTSHTLEEAATSLKKAGYTSVHALTMGNRNRTNFPE